MQTSQILAKWIWFRDSLWRNILDHIMQLQFRLNFLWFLKCFNNFFLYFPVRKQNRRFENLIFLILFRLFLKVLKVMTCEIKATKTFPGDKTLLEVRKWIVRIMSVKLLSWICPGFWVKLYLLAYWIAVQFKCLTKCFFSLHN